MMAARVSRLLLAWEPPTRSYLPTARETVAFFGRMLRGAFGALAHIPGFHHPRVARAPAARTLPHRRMREAAELYVCRAVPFGSATANAPDATGARVAAAESGRGPPSAVAQTSTHLRHGSERVGDAAGLCEWVHHRPGPVRKTIPAANHVCDAHHRCTEPNGHPFTCQPAGPAQSARSAPLRILRAGFVRREAGSSDDA